MVLRWLREIFGRGSSPPKPVGQDQGVAFDDLIKGYRFCATMQYRTPLRYLEMHGRVEPKPGSVDEEWHGIWLPEMKSLLELEFPGLDAADEPPSFMASQWGDIPSDGGTYLPFLKEVRTLFESELGPEERASRINEIRAKPKYLSIADKIPKDLGYIMVRGELTAIDGISEAIADQLWKVGARTQAEALGLSDEELLAIKGLGPSRLKRIRRRHHDGE